MANFFLLQLLRIQNTHHQMKHHSGGGEIQTNMPELTYLELGYVEAVSKAVKALWGVGRRLGRKEGISLYFLFQLLQL
jgi:hypothetical protein